MHSNVKTYLQAQLYTCNFTEAPVRGPAAAAGLLDSTCHLVKTPAYHLSS